MKKILVIAYVFPPMLYAGTYRTARLCKGLSKRGIETHVLTINIYKDTPNDFKLLEDISPHVTIHRTHIIDPWRAIQNWKKRYEGVFGYKIINKIVSLLLWLVSVPDHMIFWIPFAFFQGRKIIRRFGIDTIYISSPPHSTQMIGYLLKKYEGVRWIVDFRDPLMGNVYDLPSMTASKDPRTWVENRVKVWCERLIIRHSDRVIVNTETHKKDMSRKYPRGSFVTVRNSFETADYDGIDQRKYDSFTIAHVGSMYSLRKVDILFKAVKKMEKIIGSENLNLRILFVGLNDPYLLEDVRTLGVERYVHVEKMVPHKDAIQIMLNSHLLLLVKATGNGSNGQIPGKFYEYLGTGNRILCIGPKDSEVAQIIRQINAGDIIESDSSELTNVLLNEYGAFLNGGKRSMVQSDIDKFGSEIMAENIMNAIWSEE